MTTLGEATCTGRAQESTGPPAGSGAAQRQAVLVEAECSAFSLLAPAEQFPVVTCSEPSAVLVPA